MPACAAHRMMAHELPRLPVSEQPSFLRVERTVYNTVEPVLCPRHGGVRVRNGERFLSGTLTGYQPHVLTLMREAFDKSWALISSKYRGQDSTDDARLRLAEAIVAVTPPHAADADVIARMAIDLLMIEERNFRP